jgi:serralysin
MSIEEPNHGDGSNAMDDLDHGIDLEGIQVCTERQLSPDLLSDAADYAEMINPYNAADSSLLGDAIAASEDLGVGFGGAPDPQIGAAVLLRSKKWSPGQTLYVYFIDGPEWAHESTLRYFRYWLYEANLKFVKTRDRARSHFRITYRSGGSWSYLGTDCGMIPDDKPTMQLGWYLNTGEEDRRRVALHEVWHACGFGHEQAHPHHTIDWNKEVVYAYYQRTQGWDRRTVDQQVFFRYSQAQTNYSAYDKLSIMHYSIPREFVSDPADVVGWNTRRSRTDKTFARLTYPRNPAAQVELRDRFKRFMEAGRELVGR